MTVPNKKPRSRSARPLSRRSQARVARLADWSGQRVHISMLSGRTLALSRDDAGHLPMRQVSLIEPPPVDPLGAPQRPTDLT